MIIDGKKIANEILEDLQKKIARHKCKPALAVILIGKHPASQTYVMNKEKACNKIGVRSQIIRLENDISQKHLLEEIDKLNKDDAIDGILVQQPLPLHIDTHQVNLAISIDKDVDGFHPCNLGKLLLGDTSCFFPCTPKGIVTLLEKSHIDPAQKHVVIVGRSNIVGKPLAMMLMQKAKNANATVTVVHSQTVDISQYTKMADILVTAIGKAHFITEDMVKMGACVIDVGINREDNKLVGDVDFEKVAPFCKAITPVPGGVGPMTIASLMENTFQSFMQRKH